MQFLSEFSIWLNSISIIDFILLFLPLVIFDLSRSISKSALLLSHALYKRITQKNRNIASNLPKMTLIIPAHNEEKVITGSIESALETDYPNKEIIVVDDGSEDRTYELASSYARRNLIKLFRSDTASGSKAGPLNYGLLFASGDIIVTIDADTIIERDSLREIAHSLLDPSISAVSGNVRVLQGEKGSKNLLVRLQAYEYLLSLELGRRFSSIIGTLLIISGAFGAFWKRHITSLGRYDIDTITEDFDITIKVRKIGKRLAFAENAVSWTFAPETWKDWKRQRIRWATGQMESIWKHRNLLKKEKFDLRLVLAVYDMIFMDITLLFIRLAWLFVVLLFHQSISLHILFLGFIIYLAMEFLAISTAGILSPRKCDLKKSYLVPLIVLFYRPLCSIIRFSAYIGYFLKRKTEW